MQRCLRKPPDLQKYIFTTRLILLYLLFFPPDCPGQLVIFLPDNDVKEIFYRIMPNTWEKKIVEKGYNYLDGLIHAITEFF